MKHKVLLRNTLIAMLVLLMFVVLTSVMIAPALAQEPKEGEVGIQQVDFNEFKWDPEVITVTKRGVPNQGLGSLGIRVEGAQQIAGMTLVVGYDGAAIDILHTEIEPGLIVKGTRNVDYYLNPRKYFGTAPPNVSCGSQSYVTIDMAYLDGTLSSPIEGTGTVFNIPFTTVDNVTVPSTTTLCLDGSASLVVDNGGLTSTTSIQNITATVNIAGANISHVRFLVGLEGGKPSDYAAFTDRTEVTVNGTSVTLTDIYFDQVVATFPAEVTIERPGYVDVQFTLNNADEAEPVILLAGDTNGDNKINILDLQDIAHHLGETVNATNERMDYTGPGFNPDGIIDIRDLVIAVRNFGLSGPTSGESSGGWRTVPIGG